MHAVYQINNCDATNVQYQLFCPMFYLWLKMHRFLVDFNFITQDLKDRLFSEQKGSDHLHVHGVSYCPLMVLLSMKIFKAIMPTKVCFLLEFLLQCKGTIGPFNGFN